MTKSLIFYGSVKRPKGSAQTRLFGYTHIKWYGGKRWRRYYVRFETFDGNVSDALDAAKPRRDEVVLNTVDAEGKP